MEQSPGQKQKRKPTQVRRREIIEAGMRILTSEGARQFTADRLGAEVGITGGTIFRHFASMEEILDAIVDRMETILFEDFPPRADDPLESLRRFFEARVHVISSQPEISELLLTDTIIPNANAEYRRERLKEFKRRSRRFVMDCLTKAENHGLLADDVKPEEGAILVLGSIYAMAHRAGAGKSSPDLARRMWPVLERALRARN